MWILINNQPVCVFNIKNVSGIIAITPELFYNDDKRGSGNFSLIFPELYSLYRKAWKDKALLITDYNKNSPEGNEIVKAYERALMGSQPVFGWYFTIQLNDRATLYSSAYPSKDYAAQIRDGLLCTINKITAELPKVTI